MAVNRAADPQVTGLLRRQDGVLTRQQALDAGLSAAAIGRRIGASRWQVLLPGIYAGFTGRLAHEQRLRAALLYAEGGGQHCEGSRAMLGGATAATLYGLRQTPPTASVHLLVDCRSRPSARSFVVVRRTTRLPGARRCGAFPVAPVSIAVVDACRRMSQLDSVRALIAEAVQTGRTTVEELTVALAAGESAGSRLTRLAVKEVAAGARSVPEATMLRAVSVSGLPQPLWNTDLLTLTGRWLARPDAWWQDANTVLEIDSREWHLLPADWERTMRRHAAMTACGLLVVHATPRRIADDLDGLLATLAETLQHGRRLPPARVLTRASVSA